MVSYTDKKKKVLKPSFVLSVAVAGRIGTSSSDSSTEINVMSIATSSSTWSSSFSSRFGPNRSWRIDKIRRRRRHVEVGYRVFLVIPGRHSVEVGYRVFLVIPTRASTLPISTSICSCSYLHGWLVRNSRTHQFPPQSRNCFPPTSWQFSTHRDFVFVVRLEPANGGLVPTGHEGLTK